MGTLMVTNDRAAQLAAGARLVREQRFDEAMIVYRRLLQQHPEDEEVRAKLGVTLYRAGQFVEAEATFRHLAGGRPIAEMKPAAAVHFYNLGLTLEAQGHAADAEKAFRSALRLRPDFPKAQDKLARAINASPKPRAKRTQLEFPANEEEWVNYEADARRKALIDRKAQTDAEFRGLPAWAKLLMVIITVAIVATMGFVFVKGIGPSDIEKQQGKFTREQCDDAKAHGLILSGC